MLDINISDVVAILKLCVPYLIFFGIVLVIGIIAMIACRKLPKYKKFMIRRQSFIAILLALVIAVNLICYGPMSTLIGLATGSGTITEESSARAEALGTEIAREGIVLLENEENLLPLANQDALNIFGWASTNPCYGGTGSGALSGAYETVSLMQGLEHSGFKLNSELSDFYTAYRDTRPEVGLFEQDWTLPEPPASTYPDTLISQAKEFSDTAMVVITRVGGEGADLPHDMNMETITYEDNSSDYKDYPEGTHYLQLSQSERDMVELVCSNFENVIFVYNGANAFQLSDISEYEQIKSVIWCPSAGQTGFDALGEIVKGEVNPSGRTTDTFVADLTQTPYYNNIGDFTYTNMDEFTVTSEFTDGVPSFVNYVEGIYVGYRYYETAAAENAIDYDTAVQYPFGYGMSYTNFSQEMGELTIADGNINVDVTVTNTGDVAGKEVVQLYYTPPYTNGGIEKAAVNLAAFDKTKELAPGESETLTLSFKEEDMASYDTYNAGAWVLESGDYEISLRTDSHNVIDSKTHQVADTITYNEEAPRSTDDIAAVNQFDFAEGDVTYLSRADGFANLAEAVKAPATLEMAQHHKELFQNDANYDPAEHNDENAEMPTFDADNGMEILELRGADYDDERWDTLLDQMSVDEMADMIALGGYGTAAISSIGKIATVDCDGPASINNNFTGVGSIGLPCAVMIANSFNEDIALAFGDSIGEMADDMEVSGWYAPAMNAHRSAFAGRNFEYYSEDGLLSGKMATNAVLGAEQHGVYAYIKHFVLNDQEANRWRMLCTWSNEQAIREIYLKPFELAVKEGNSKGVMSAYNYIGTEWAGSSSQLLNTVLRDEWGFRGVVLTDYFAGFGYMDADRMIRSGGDTCLIAFDNSGNILDDTESATARQGMRTASKNILYAAVNSRAFDTDAIQMGLRPWQIAGIVIDIVLGAGFVLLEVLAFRKYKAKKQTAEIKVETAEKPAV